MPVNPITTYTSNFGDTSDGSTRVPAKMLDQNDFLRLLITQMTSQDPMNPKADLDSIAQMASFSSLEQSKAMQADMQQMSSVLQANGMLGRTVQLQIDSENTGTGVVEAVKFVDGVPKIVVAGVSYDLTQVTTITPTVISAGEQP